MEEFHLDVSLCFRVVEEGGVVIRRRNDHAADSGFGQMDAFGLFQELFFGEEALC